jgi:hypothetical protein
MCALAQSSGRPCAMQRAISLIASSWVGVRLLREAGVKRQQRDGRARKRRRMMRSF